MDLKNGFRYSRELLIQHHNCKMYCDSVKLEEAGLSVFSVGTYAFAMREGDLDLAQQSIKISAEIGGWRISNMKIYKYLHVSLLL